MFYTVYKITNTINEKIYIGVHKTTDVYDNYMGSGIHLKRAQEKYGIENFKKEILEVFDNSKDMFNMEAILVNEEFVQSKETYNLKLGGFGGWDYIHNLSENELFEIRSKGGKNGCNKCLMHQIGMFSKESKKLATDTLRDNYINWTFGGKTHSEESKDKMKLTHKDNRHQQGSKNSQYGKIWIYNTELKECKRIYKDEEIAEGWLKGRKMKFSS